MHYSGYLCNTSRCNQTKQTKVSTERVNQYLDFLIDPSFPGVNRFFVLPFEMSHKEQVTNNIIFQLEK